MKEPECECLVMICSSEENIREQSHKYVEYLKVNKIYTGEIVKKHFNGDLRLELDTGEEIHFVLKQEFSRWSTGRKYRTLEPWSDMYIASSVKQEGKNGNSTDNSI